MTNKNQHQDMLSEADKENGHSPTYWRAMLEVVHGNIYATDEVIRRIQANSWRRGYAFKPSAPPEEVTELDIHKMLFQAARENNTFDKLTKKIVEKLKEYKNGVVIK